MAKAGYRVMSFNPRGAGIPALTYNLFDYRNLVDELETVVEYISHKYP